MFDDEIDYYDDDHYDYYSMSNIKEKRDRYADVFDALEKANLGSSLAAEKFKAAFEEMNKKMEAEAAAKVKF